MKWFKYLYLVLYVSKQIASDSQEVRDDEGPQRDGHGELCQGEVESDMANTIRVLSLGRLEYLQTLRIQHHLADRLKAARGNQQADNVLILVEHPPVYTTGMRTKVGQHLPVFILCQHILLP